MASRGDGGRTRGRLRRGSAFLRSRIGRVLLGAVLGVVLITAGVVTFYWYLYARMIDEHLSGHVNQTTARVYSAPGQIFSGETLTAAQLGDELERAGYDRSNSGNPAGWYSTEGDVIEIHPGPDSYFGQKNALRVEFTGHAIRGIRLLDDGSTQDSAQIEPELLTNLFDSAREKRRKVAFDEIPQVMVNAVLSAEDKRFFEHPGFDIVRIFGAAWADIRHTGMEQGASTLTMQVSRSFFFTTERTWRRKLAETMVSLELEHRFTKKQIFELYANEIYLGNRDSFAIHGFGEGAQAYFNKDIRDLSVGEAAFLAGIIRAPNRYSSADRRPERAAEARDRVLAQMTENHYITAQQERDAKKAPLNLTPGGMGGGDAPYFVDMVKDHLLDHFSEAELLSQNFRIYTTLDPQIQRAATDALAIGIANVDQQLARSYARWKKAGQPTEAQAAMIVVDPHTGQIRAVIGGRDYGQSQLNRALARRQPGSVFKPIVYAAAFDNAVEGISPVVTPATTVEDEPTTFEFDGKDYTPNNYGQEFHGTVTAREALTDSLNVATVKVAEMIGYGRVVDMAKQIGIDDNLVATPALALGAYEMTPVEVAGAYTTFANGGTRAEPFFIDRVVSADGGTLERGTVRTKQVLDPRVAYLVTDVLEDVIDHGTGAGVRARGFEGPAAGKTGTSRDGWFAGYTSNLLCIVWVGFDDNRDLTLSGAASAGPIWAEFMKRATALPAYRDLQDFTPPDGVTSVELDPETLQLATPSCPIRRPEVFISGTEPTQYCELHGGGMPQGGAGSWLSRVFGGHKDESDDPAGAEAAPGTQPAPGASRPRPRPKPADPNEASGPPPPEKKPGLLERIFGIFGGRKDQENSN
jgi:penicillin-binding protein 1B